MSLTKPRKACMSGYWGSVLAAHDDGLEVLGAQQRAHAAPSGGAGVLLAALHHAGKAHQVLAGRADAGQLGLGIGLGAELVKGRKVVQAPQVAGGADLDFAVVDPEVDRLCRPPGDDQAVEAGKAQLGAPVAAHVGLVPDAGQRRAAAPRAAAAGGRKGAGQQAVEGQQRAGRDPGDRGRGPSPRSRSWPPGRCPTGSGAHLLRRWPRRAVRRS